ncbi:MAG: hypothetical protein ACKOA4_11170, partial [Haliscomenobacter sp.]
MNPLFPKCRLLLFVAVGIAFFALPVHSQTVIGGDTMDASAMLDVQSIDRGVLLPRLTTAQRDAIARPAFGLMVLNTTLQCVEINLGSAVAPEWKCLSTAQGMLNLSALDTAYWNRKLGAGDTLSLSARIDRKLAPGDTLSLSNRIDGKLSGFTESDPVFRASLAQGITGVDTAYWNSLAVGIEKLSLIVDSLKNRIYTLERLCLGNDSLPPYVPLDGLVGWWPFDGNAKDKSGNRHDGTINGVMTTEDRRNSPEK